MSRSTRYTPIISNTLSDSEKDDKRIANRSFRRKNRCIICDSLMTDNLEDMILIDYIEEVSDVWGFNKDGKHYLSKSSRFWDDKYMRK